MIKHIWSVLCQSTVIDNETNNISIINVFEQVDIEIKKAVAKASPINIPINYELITFWAKISNNGSEKANVKVEISDPKEKLLKEFNQVLEITANKKRIRGRIKISGLSITTSGTYTFAVSYLLKDKKAFQKVAEIPLDVNLRIID